MMQAVYQRWLEKVPKESPLYRDLQSLSTHPEEIEQRFSTTLDFGTGGLRGLMGAGTNRLNIYTIRKATRALGQFVLDQWRQRSHDTRDIPAIAIGYDCRHDSQLFAYEAARTLAAMNIRSYVAKALCPTPVVSFSVRHLQAAAGIMITASHNPPAYNGYKVYGSDGCQLLPDAAGQVHCNMDTIADVFDIPVQTVEEARKAALLLPIPDATLAAYTNAVVRDMMKSVVAPATRRTLRVVYTPLHGTGLVPISEVFAQSGYTQFATVAAQSTPDPDFSTVKSPNPEEHEALTLAIAEAKVKEASLVLATDPDADRVGAAVRQADGHYVQLTGNQLGALLIDFLVETARELGTELGNGVLIKTIVTGNLGAAIATAAGLQIIDTLTGFKYIGHEIGQLEQKGNSPFVFGYEESYGYLAAPFVRDKDAVQICLLTAEATAYWRQKGITLVERLAALQSHYGFHLEALLNFALAGEDGVAKMHDVLAQLRQSPLLSTDSSLTAVEDYEIRVRRDYHVENAHGDYTESPLTLPESDVLKFFYSDGSTVAVRPSGTEPKLKAYVAVIAPSDQGAQSRLSAYETALHERVRI